MAPPSSQSLLPTHVRLYPTRLSIGCNSVALSQRHKAVSKGIQMHVGLGNQASVFHHWPKVVARQPLASPLQLTPRFRHLKKVQYLVGLLFYTHLYQRCERPVWPRLDAVQGSQERTALPHRVTSTTDHTALGSGLFVRGRRGNVNTVRNCFCIWETWMSCRGVLSVRTNCDSVHH